MPARWYNAGMSVYTNLLRSVALPAGSMLAGYRDVMPYLRALEE